MPFIPCMVARAYTAIVKRLVLLLFAALVFGVAGSPGGVDAAAGWRITSFDAVYNVDTEGTLNATETIKVDFGSLQKHGIFRSLVLRSECVALRADSQPATYDCPLGSDRRYDYTILGVEDSAGKGLKYSVSDENLQKIIKIGDADVFISGRQDYVIRYRLKGALDPYSDHDELYWNASGDGWSESPIDRFSLTLNLPPGANLATLCYQGSFGSTDNCESSASGSTAKFASTRPVNPFEGVTIVAGWQKGIVSNPVPVVIDRVSADDFFTLDAAEFGGIALVAILSILSLIALWWGHGRDRAYRSLYYLTNDPSEGTRGLFARDNIVVEYTPPDDLRPAEMGLILDERADTQDVTATIIDLAVRGYLKIKEIPKEGLFGSTDWELTKVERADELSDYERKLYDGLFMTGTPVEMSDLKNTFAPRLQTVKDSLYSDSMKRKWFGQKPETARTAWVLVGVGVLVLGIALSFLSGYFLGRALIATPVILAGLVLVILSRAMGRRTSTGSEALRRVLGFRLYISTAETRRQEFNEQENIFAKYLPFAIVFGCVGKWAKAFEGLENQAASSTSGWYSGTRPFQVVAFASGLQHFSSSVGSTIASSPSSSGGGSGFSGGSSGGGGGGGGGGSW